MAPHMYRPQQRTPHPSLQLRMVGRQPRRHGPTLPSLVSPVNSYLWPSAPAARLGAQRSLCPIDNIFINSRAELSTPHPAAANDVTISGLLSSIGQSLVLILHAGLANPPAYWILACRIHIETVLSRRENSVGLENRDLLRPPNHHFQSGSL